MNDWQTIILLVVTCLLGGGVLGLTWRGRRSGTSGPGAAGEVKSNPTNLPAFPELPPAAAKPPDQREQDAQTAKHDEENRIEKSDPAHILADTPDAAAHRADIAAVQSGFRERLRARLAGVVQRGGSGSDAAGGSGRG